METPQFEKLEERINLALDAINNLKSKNKVLEEQLNTSNGESENFGQILSQKDEELAQLQEEVQNKTIKMTQAGERVDSLLAKLEEENLEQILN